MKEIRYIAPTHVIITGRGDYNPMQQWRRIEDELTEMQFEGTVSFDMLSTTGLVDRFYESPFDGKKLSPLQLRQVDLDEHELKMQNVFFRQRPDWLEDANISNEERANF